MIRKLEILRNDRSGVKVTIAADRTSIKVPIDMPQAEVDLVTIRVTSIEAEVRAQSKWTVRGMFQNKALTLLRLFSKRETPGPGKDVVNLKFTFKESP